jgi:thioredoxin reductase (NADPH)
LLDRLRAQVAEYGVSVTPGTVNTLERLSDGSFVARAATGEWHAQTVILATGVVDVEPDFPEVKQALAAGFLRYCPICDGFEASGRKVAVIGRGKSGLGEALFVRHYTPEISLFSIAGPIALDSDEGLRIDRAGLRVVHEPLARLAYGDDGIRVHLHDGRPERFDVVYAALGTMVNTGLAQLLGARCTAEGCVLVDEHQQTSVEGIYAAGDIVAGLNQITVAMGQAAVAATAIHNRLRM